MAHSTQTHQHTFENGLTLVAQEMPWLQSAAFTMAFPAGCRFDPSHQLGMANFTCEMVFRGGGQFDNRGLVEELEGLGCDYYSTCGVYHTFFGGALPAEGLESAMRVYAEVINEPHFPEAQLEDGRNACLQDIQALDDDLPGKTTLESRLRFYGDPYGRNSDGTLEAVSAMRIEELKEFYQRHYQPQGMLIAVAGKFNWPTIRQLVAELFGRKSAQDASEPTVRGGERGYRHLEFPSNQTYISLAWPGLPFRDENYYLLRGAIGVLSDGMSSRLFREVRERRGLCYSVGAHCHAILDRGAVFGYSATTTQSAQQTLDVMLEQIGLLSQGITQSELERMQVQFRSGLVMQQESCRSRVSALAGDLFHLGRIRSMEEIQNQIQSLTVQGINDYLASNPLGPFDIVTLGEMPLEITGAIPTTAT
jgi:predicted Zn-dependent peptidase